MERDGDEMKEDPPPQPGTGQGQGQLCDLCDEFVLFSDILEHLFIHVGPLYLLNCPNPQCPHMFTNYKSLEAHFYGKGNRKRFPNCGQMARETKIMRTCISCHFVASTHSNLRKHLKKLHETDSSKTKKYECPVTGCEKSFRVLQSVNFHLQKHRQSASLTDFQDCQICGETLEIDLIQEHLKECHNTEEVHGCVQCPFKFVSRDALLEHVGYHLRIGILCNLCDDNDGVKVKYLNWNDYRLHCHHEHGDPLGKIECEWCDSKFWRKEDAYEHASVKHKDKGRAHWKCEVEGCGKSFQRKNQWRGHYWKFHHAVKMEPGHGHEQGQLCDICNEYISFSDILVHLIAHVGPLYVLKCPNPQCLHIFTKYKSLETHFFGKGDRKRFANCLRIAREVRILSTCKACGFVADTHPNLRHHLEDLHELDSSREKTYACPVTGCGKIFAVLQSVHFHLQNHQFPSTSTIFQNCEICGEYLNSDFIEAHLKERHGTKGEEINGCVQCPFKCVSRNFLLKHVRSHLHVGILCNLCNNQHKYFKWEDFREHCHYKHGDPLEKVKCEWCESTFWRKEDAYTHATAKHKDKDELGMGHWKCEVEGCGGRFQQKRQWKDHLNKFH